MKVNLKSKNGITLVALIITIIVLLILAMVSIALVMNSGIITKSKTAVDKYSEEEIQEQIKLAYSEWQMGQYTGVTDDAPTFVQNKLNSIYGAGTVANVTAENGILTVELTNGKTYTYNVTTGTAEKVAKWNDNGDDTFTNSETGTKVQIGDIVNYNELSNGAKSYTTDTTKGIGGNVGTQDSTTGKWTLNSKTYTTEDLTWRVLGVNERGQIELISENPTSEDVYLANEEGYLYGPDALNTMCNDLYGKGTGAISARNLNKRDLDKLAGIKTDADRKALNNDYGTKWKYRYPTTEEDSVNRNMQYNKNTGSGYSNIWTNITNNTKQKFKMPGTDDSTEINSTNPGDSPELTNAFYYYNFSQKIIQTTVDGKKIVDIIEKGTTENEITQWLSTNFVWCQNDGVAFFVEGIGASYVYGNTGIYISNNNNNYYYYKARPVVTLKSNVKLSGSSESGWTIE